MDEKHEMKHERWEMEQLQSLGLHVKILMTKQRLRDWLNEYGEDNCYVRMNLSAESLVLLHLVKWIAVGNIKVSFGDTDGHAISPWMASEDESGLDDWLRFGCNHYDTEKPESRPMAFWTKEDVLQYIKEYTDE